MRTLFRRLVILLPALVVLTDRAAGQTDPGWLGREVLARTPDVKLKVGNRVVGTVPGATVLRVEQVQGQWLWLGRGWVEASEVVPVGDAVAFFTTEIESSPSSFAYLSRAQAYLARGNYVLAIIDLRKTSKRLDRDSKNLEALSRAKLHLKLQRWDDAIADLTSAIRHDKTDPLLFDTRASAWERKGDYERALEDLNEAIRLDSEQAYLFSGRARLRLKLGQEDLALQDLAEASRLEPQEPLYYLIQATILAVSGSDGVRNGPRAVEFATKGCELRQWRNPFDLSALAAAYAESGDFGSAIRWEEKSLELAGADAAFRQRSQQRLDLYRRRTSLHTHFATNSQRGTQKR